MFPDYKKLLNAQAGITLFEFVITTVIVGMVAAVAVGILSSQTETFIQVYNRSVLLCDGEKALRVLRADLQEISPGNISVMTASQLTFKRVSNGNQIRYRFRNGVLTRNGRTILGYMTSSPFSYYDASEAVTSTAADVSMIIVDLDLSVNNQVFDFQERIYVRN